MSRDNYKFQRLREQIRQALVGGEFKGKLPGERALSARFAVNAKTLSKALNDLTAEGLLERNIGRGTFVRGTTTAPVRQRRWLVVCDTKRQNCPMLDHLRQAKADVEVIEDITHARPSFLNRFGAVIDYASNTPDPVLRDLLVRNVCVILAGKEPQSFSLPAVLLDRQLSLVRMGRTLLLQGHRHIGVRQDNGQANGALETLRLVGRHFNPNVRFESVSADTTERAVNHGMTAVICATRACAEDTLSHLQKLKITVPAQVAVLATDVIHSNAPCSGYFIDYSQKAEAILNLLENGTVKRPSTLWLAGRFIDQGTSGPFNTPHGTGNTRFA